MHGLWVCGDGWVWGGGWDGMSELDWIGLNGEVSQCGLLVEEI